MPQSAILGMCICKNRLQRAEERKAGKEGRGVHFALLHGAAKCSAVVFSVVLPPAGPPRFPPALSLPPLPLVHNQVHIYTFLFSFRRQIKTFPPSKVLDFAEDECSPALHFYSLYFFSYINLIVRLKGLQAK